MFDDEGLDLGGGRGGGEVAGEGGVGVGGEAGRGHQGFDALVGEAFAEALVAEVEEAVLELEDVDGGERVVALVAHPVLDLEARPGRGDAEVGEIAGEEGDVVAVPAFDPVVAGKAEDEVVVLAADDPVVAVRAGDQVERLQWIGLALLRWLVDRGLRWRW